MRRRAGGFTLLEVMFALAILFGSLAILIRASARNAATTQDAKALTIVTGLARGKMYDLEEELIHEGFQETAETMEGDFGDEGYPKIAWSATIEKIELPGVGALQNEAGEKDVGGMSQNQLDGIIGGITGDPSGGGMAGMGLGVIQSQFEMVKDVLEKSIRKVTLTVTWHVGKREEKMSVVCYFTNPTAVDEAVQSISALESLAGQGGNQGNQPQTPQQPQQPNRGAQPK